MQKLLFIITLTAVLALASILSYADIQGPDWKLGQKTYMNEHLVMTADLEIDMLGGCGALHIPIVVHIESEDNGIYPVTQVNELCTVSGFEECNIVDTDWYNDVSIDPSNSYMDLTSGISINPYDPPDDITPLRVKNGSTPYMRQIWEVYDKPGEWDDLSTSRREYQMSYELEFQCTPSQGEWDQSMVDPSLSCNEAEFGTWKQMGNSAMIVDMGFFLTSRYLILPFGFPIYDTKPQFTQSDTPIQLIGDIAVPLQIFSGNYINVDQTKTYDLVFNYNDGDQGPYQEPVHGDCIDDEQVYMEGTATNIDNPEDVVSFEQWYSEGLQYLSKQIISGINIDVDDTIYPALTISGSITLDEVSSTVTNRTNAIDFTHTPDPLVRTELAYFNESFFIMGPGHGPDQVNGGFFVIDPPLPDPYANSNMMECGMYNNQPVATLIIPANASDQATLQWGLQFLGTTDVGGEVVVDIIDP